jgi:hypothetical protein
MSKNDCHIIENLKEKADQTNTIQSQLNQDFYKELMTIPYDSDAGKSVLNLCKVASLEEVMRDNYYNCFKSLKIMKAYNKIINDQYKDKITTDEILQYLNIVGIKCLSYGEKSYTFMFPDINLIFLDGSLKLKDNIDMFNDEELNNIKALFDDFSDKSFITLIYEDKSYFIPYNCRSLLVFTKYIASTEFYNFKIDDKILITMIKNILENNKLFTENLK